MILEKPGRNLDSLAQNDALTALKATLLHEWHVRDRFDDVEEYGIRPTTMALFYGPPGNGKTMAAKLLAREMDAPLYRVTCNGLLGSYLGESESNMGSAMEFLASAGECVVLFDECEALFRSRTMSEGATGTAIARTMQVFWQAVDRWESPQLFLLATNQRDNLDSALLSRCEHQIEFCGPTKEQVEMVLSYWEEVLHENGAETWGPDLRQRFRKKPPESFRHLWQQISHEVRVFIVSKK